MEYTKHFSALGFNESEVKVYLGLAEVGKSTAGVLAKRLDIARTTVYSVLGNLIQKGVISQEEKKGTTFYLVNKPQSLLRNVERERQELQQKEQAARELIQIVTPLFRAKFFSVPKLQFFDGRAGVESMLYDNFADWQATLPPVDPTWWGFQDHAFVQCYRDWLQHYWKLKAPNEKIKLFSNYTPLEQELRGKVIGREIRQLQEELEFTSTVWVVGDYIILIMARQEPHYAFQLRDTVFAGNLRSVFRLLWEAGSPPIKKPSKAPQK